MYFHWQNLKKEDRTRHLLYGRAWLEEWNFEWSVPTRFWHCHVNLNYYDEAAIGFSLALGLFSIHIETRNRWLYRKLEKITKRKERKYTNGRIIGWSFHDNTLWVSLWEYPMEYSVKDPKWWKFNIDFADLLLGKHKHTVEVLGEGKAQINMPEGPYDAIYKIEKRTWKRLRWLFKTTRESIWFDIPVGIPHWGKGENSWDCGMDATFGTGTDWKGDIYSAAKRIAMRCLETRQRYGPLNDPEYLKWKQERESKLNQEGALKT